MKNDGFSTKARGFEASLEFQLHVSHCDKSVAAQGARAEGLCALGSDKPTLPIVWVGLGLERAWAREQSGLITPKVFSSFRSVSDTQTHVRGWWLSLKMKEGKKKE